MTSRQGQEWLLDEYFIVGDLWKRRGRTVGARDPEVREIAKLLGRSEASISYRIGNFAGTDREDSSGLKPIAGEPLEAWKKVRDDPAALAAAVSHARARVALLSGADPAEPATDDRKPRIVAPEKPSTETATFTSETKEKTVRQTEALLRESFSNWLDPKGKRLQGIEIPAGASKLRVDLYDPETAVLIEVKASAERNYLRLAVGQLIDYERYLDFAVRLAVLVPSRPTDDLMGLLKAAKVEAIWPSGKSFQDSVGGTLLSNPDDTIWGSPAPTEAGEVSYHE